VGISRRLYPVPFETGRLAGLLAGAILAYGISLLLPGDGITGLMARGTVVAAFAVVVAMAVRPRDRAPGL